MNYYLEEVKNGCIMNIYAMRGTITETMIFHSIYDAIEYIKWHHGMGKKKNPVKKLFEKKVDSMNKVGDMNEMPRFTY